MKNLLEPGPAPAEDVRTPATVADAILTGLAQAGVRTVIGFPGETSLPLYVAAQRQDAVRHVMARCPRCAGYMAEAYARVSGEVGVCDAPGGIGSPFTTPALLEAYNSARTLDEAREVAGRIGFPLVMKPLIGGGSMYVRRVNDLDELTEHFEPIRRGSWDGFDYDPLYASSMAEYRGALLLEGYLPGGEISVESMVVDGVTKVVAIHDKPLPMNGPFFEEIYYVTPTSLPSEVVARVHEITARAHEALGITMGATHTEFRIQEGEEPKILETAARLGGGPIYQSLLLSTGVDMVEALCDVALGRTPDLTPRQPATPTGFYLIFAEKAGRIKAIHGVDAALADPNVQELLLYRNVGDEVNVPPHVWQAHGHVIFTARTHAELGDVFDRLAKTIRFEVE